MAGATAAGIRYQGRPDLALMVSEVPATAAGVFTTNRVKAAPVLLSRSHLAHSTARAILVNSGIANACTGEPGLERARLTARMTAEAVGCRAEEVLVASTGIIGMPLPLEPLAGSLPTLVAQVRADGWLDAARAIMTTDTVPKIQMERIRIENSSVTVLGIAKGAGMICPDMATLLSFVVTDAAITSGALQTVVREETLRSFNRITIDGDTSTNDTLFVLANGLAAHTPIESLTSPAGEVFRQALRKVLLNLAKKIVADGEGATKFVEIRVVGASRQIEAVRGARTVANSPLVKTALFGEDANWGRVLAALGRAGIDFDPNRVQLYFGDVKLVENGLFVGEQAEKKASEIMSRSAFSITVDLRQGDAEESVYTCDLSLDYVKINADYRS
ncbi:MAG: bifunctional glutamate N-acetyltransferase/amino-acid acetyltransferase ArgJ [Deltaproteobacteria bacterium]|nr:MAG: bifunctional glutamate N-acetyltransferase/amino-acid acetyltransferase ArgJ [Deltaproteobacteria bacterium]